MALIWTFAAAKTLCGCERGGLTYQPAEKTYRGALKFFVVGQGKQNASPRYIVPIFSPTILYFMHLPALWSLTNAVFAPKSNYMASFCTFSERIFFQVLGRQINGLSPKTLRPPLRPPTEQRARSFGQNSWLAAGLVIKSVVFFFKEDTFRFSAKKKCGLDIGIFSFCPCEGSIIWTLLGRKIA